MKLIRFYAIIVALILFLSACSDGGEIHRDEPDIRDTPDASGVLAEQPSEVISEPEAVTEYATITERLREEVRLKLLADFDYLVAEIEANMPLSGVIYRRVGIDLTTHFATMRTFISEATNFGQEAETIEEMERAGADFLFSYLHSQTERKFEGLGHLRPKSHAFHVGMVVEQRRFLDDEENIITPLAIEYFDTFTDPAALWFYDLDVSELDFNDERFGMFRRDYRAIETKIHTQDKIAWINISHAFNDSDYDRENLLPFFKEIQNYPHLIIDLRGHRGGFQNHFLEVIMEPLLAAPVYMQTHSFFMDGERAQRTMESYMILYNEMRAKEMSDVINIYDAADYVRSNNMTEFNQQDLEMLTHVVEASSEIEPMKDGYPFNGKIWVLVDRGTASAAEAAVMMVMSSGFATVVGTPTAGIMPSDVAFVLLPNTGIIFRMDIGYFTDASGRSLEEFGISPDIHNREGLNAEQTVLELISEGN